MHDDDDNHMIRSLGRGGGSLIDHTQTWGEMKPMRSFSDG